MTPLLAQTQTQWLDVTPPPELPPNPCRPEDVQDCNGHGNTFGFKVPIAPGVDDRSRTVARLQLRISHIVGP